MNTFEKGMTQLLVAQLAELYFCEKELLHALDEMAEAAVSEDLEAFLRSHRRDTQEHIGRLESMFNIMQVTPRAHPCRAIAGLLEDGQAIRRTLKDDPILDLGLIAAAHRIEMMEISSYRSAIALARKLGLDEVAALCELSMAEEKNADSRLTELSGSGKPAAVPLS